MSQKVLTFELTPNPNALKCVLKGEVPPLPTAADGAALAPGRSYRSPEQAAGDPLALALFSVAGVQGVLIGSNWITISKAPAAGWLAIKAGVEKALAAAH